jgi:hypothetical protein
MTPPGFVQALVTRADLKGAEGTQELSDLLDDLFDLIAQKKGKELVSSSINGKSFAFAVNMTVEEAFGAVGEALRELNPIENGGKIPQTYGDFSCLQR